MDLALYLRFEHQILPVRFLCGLQAIAFFLEVKIKRCTSLLRLKQTHIKNKNDSKDLRFSVTTYKI